MSNPTTPVYRLDPVGASGAAGSSPLGSADADGLSRANAQTQRILNNRRFQELVRERSGFAWTMSITMLAIYLVFIGLVAFAHGVMAIKLGGAMSLGILLGLIVIIAAFALTGVYVRRANGRFDALTRELYRELGR